MSRASTSFRRASNKDVDGRDKSGHDDVDAQFLPRLRGRVGRGPAASRLARAATLALPRVASAYTLRASADSSRATPPRAPTVRDPPPAGEGEARAPLQRRLLQLINPLLRRRFPRRALVGVELGDEIVEADIGLAAGL